MIIRTDKGYEINSEYPNENWYENENNYIVDETTDAGKLLADKIKSKFPYYDLVVSDGQLTDVTPYSPITATTDKPQITADGTDTATITATVDDTTSTETIELYHGETLVDSKPAVNGVATFEVTMTEQGTLTLTVKSTTKYGQADVSVEGV
jgi:hypothetical protein